MYKNNTQRKYVPLTGVSEDDTIFLERTISTFGNIVLLNPSLLISGAVFYVLMLSFVEIIELQHFLHGS